MTTTYQSIDDAEDGQEPKTASDASSKLSPTWSKRVFACLALGACLVMVRRATEVDADPKTTALYTCLPEGTDCGTARAPLDVGLTCCSGFHCEASLTLLVTVVGSCKASSPGPDTPGRPTRDAPLANQICKQSAGAPEYKCQCDLPCISAHGNGQKKCDDCYPLLTDGSPCPFDAYSAKHDACAFNG
mmetsp:Transcript_36069/g.111611  ORF Transcript_36069/g.111611 Transcript_36069/m.111611 type:complete len:188 (+) Transcript_36069:138-701(+)